MVQSKDILRNEYIHDANDNEKGPRKATVKRTNEEEQSEW